MESIIINTVGVFVAFIVILFFNPVRIVKQQTLAIVTTFGRYSRTLGPGLNFIFAPFQQIEGKVDLRTTEVKAHVNIKTSDNMFVLLPVSIQLRVDSGNAVAAFYKLTNPEQQISTWVLNAIRSVSSDMTLDDMFKDRERVVAHVATELKGRLSGFGYELDAVLIDEPTVSESVQESFNQVVAARRLAEAATEQGKADKIRLVAIAEGEAEAQRERAKGLSDARKTLARGITESMAEFQKHGVSIEESMGMLTEINRIDALREVGKHNNMVLVDLAGGRNIALTLPATQKQTGGHADNPGGASGGQGTQNT